MTDRAPSEVETVARALQQRFGSRTDWNVKVAEEAIAALDAVRGRSREDWQWVGTVDGVAVVHRLEAEARGRSRDDTVTLTEALERIAGHPTVVRNPDGVDQAAATMQLIARGALARFDAGRADRTDL